MFSGEGLVRLQEVLGYGSRLLLCCVWETMASDLEQPLHSLSI